MTGTELRGKVRDIINGWIGATKGSAGHQEILRLYNTQKPLPNGYAVRSTDAYCATTVSAAWIKAGIAAYTGTECSCPRFITLAQKKGIWVENDAYVPKVGDAVLYDWQDTGAGDNTGVADHIGIVTRAGNPFVVTEGNMSGGRVGTRQLAVNGRYIRGFITPDYDAVAKALGGSAAPAASSSAAQNVSTTVTHKVEFGDTLWDIARKYGTTVAKLQELNRIDNVNWVPLGTVLKVR